jgi:hypothetical protein
MCGILKKEPTFLEDVSFVAVYWTLPLSNKKVMVTPTSCWFINFKGELKSHVKNQSHHPWTTSYFLYQRTTVCRFMTLRSSELGQAGNLPTTSTPESGVCPS